jgi:hypothetical protein
MSRKQKRKNGAPKATPPPEPVEIDEDAEPAMLHALPVRPTTDPARPEGMLVLFDGVSLRSVSVLRREIAEEFDVQSVRLPGVDGGAWWLSDEDPGVDVASMVEALDGLAQDEGLPGAEGCYQCLSGNPCDAWDVGSLPFVPRPPPPPALDPEAIQQIVAYMTEAEQDGLAMDLISTAIAQFCALRPRYSSDDGPTMTVPEAVEVLGIAWPCDAATVERAFRDATQQHHPDRGGDASQMKRVIAAKKTLKAHAESAS